MTIRCTTVESPDTWDRLLVGLPAAHLLQSWEWGEVKQRYGWRAERLAWLDLDGHARAAAQVLERTLAIPGARRKWSVLYCPRGPALDWSDGPTRQAVLEDLGRRARDRGAIFLKIDPDLPIGFGFPGEPDGHDAPDGLGTATALRDAGWRESDEQVQFRNTLLLDLRPDEADLLARMKPKTRYNIRLAERHGVLVRPGNLDDLDLLYAMYAETSLRDGFVIRTPAYYRDAWGTFIESGLAQPFLATVTDEAVAGLIVYRFAGRAWYLYGMSRQIHRDKMPTHLLQWHAIRWARAQGCHTYDLWGAPDTPDRADPLWGVHRFKEGFGARLVRTLGAWDYPCRPGLYWLYRVALPRLLAVMRLRGRAATRHSLEAA